MASTKKPAPKTASTSNATGKGKDAKPKAVPITRGRVQKALDGTPFSGDEVKELKEHDVQTIYRLLAEIEKAKKATPELIQKRHVFLRDFVAKSQAPPPDLPQSELKLQPGQSVDLGGFLEIYSGNWKTMAITIRAFRLFGVDEKTAKQLRVRFKLEAAIWKDLTHPYLLSIYGTSEQIMPKRLCLIAEGGTSTYIMKYLEAHPNANRLLMLYQIACALNYLHTRKSPVVHGDVKPVNIFVRDDGTVAISNYGILQVEGANLVLDNFNQETSLHFVAPEAVSVEQLPIMAGVEADVFSFARTAYQVMTNQLPLPKTRLKSQLIAQVKKGEQPSKHESIPDSMWQWMTKCWELDSKKRPSMVEILGKLRAAVVESMDGLVEFEFSSPSGEKVLRRKETTKSTTPAPKSVKATKTPKVAKEDRSEVLVSGLPPDTSPHEIIYHITSPRDGVQVSRIQGVSVNPKKAQATIIFVGSATAGQVLKSLNQEPLRKAEGKAWPLKYSKAGGGWFARLFG